MSHVDDGQLNALLDGELSGEEARAVESHVATCADCRRRLEEARAFLHGANALLDSLSPLAAPAPGPAPAPDSRTEEPARPSRQSVPVRPVGGLADLPGGEAGSVRPPIPPAAKPPMAPAASAPAAPQPPRKVAKTLREVAVDIDGRTALTPGIRPVFADELAAAPAAAVPSGQRVKPARRGWDLEKLAWAANIVLALGVGYLANEVRWMHSERQPITARADAVVVRVPAGPTQIAAQTRARAVRPPAATGHAGVRLDKTPRARGPKPATSELAATGDLALQAPPATERAFARPAPANVASSAAQGAGVSGLAAAPAPSRAQPATSNLLAPRASRTNALDEAAARPTPGFTRITMEEAVRTLSGSIRQIDGMTPIRIEAAGGRLVAGSDASREVVRVDYTDQFGRRFTLDQQLAEPRAGPAFNGIMPGDTLVTTVPEGGSRVRWMDGKFWLSLTGPVPANDVRALVGRVR